MQRSTVMVVVMVAVSRARNISLNVKAGPHATELVSVVFCVDVMHVNLMEMMRVVPVVMVMMMMALLLRVHVKRPLNNGSSDRGRGG
jgi:hypothetical protein